MCGTCACGQAGDVPVAASVPVGPEAGALDASAAVHAGPSPLPSAPGAAPIQRLLRPVLGANPDPGNQGKPASLRQLTLLQRLLAHNATQAAANRRRFQAAGVRAVNLLSSPGSGKTALLERLARDGQARGAMAALVGDLATDLDARRLQDAGLPSVQLNTGQACHLDAAMVARGLETLEASGIALTQLRWLWIENVGNLVCPAAYDLGEDRRLVLLAVGEGEDKPLKYPAMFRSADLVVITKLDLAEAVGFDRRAARTNIARVAPTAAVLETSARSGAGLAELLALC